MPVVTEIFGTAIVETVERQRAMYDGSDIDVRMRHLIRDTRIPPCRPGIFNACCVPRARCISTAMWRSCPVTIPRSTCDSNPSAVSRPRDDHRVQHG